MNAYSTKKLALNGLMIALVFLATYFTRIPEPIPPGYVNIGDAAIILAAVLLGKKSGFISGAIGSCIADLVSGAFIYAPVTFIVKGLEGLVIGIIAYRTGKMSSFGPRRIIGVIVGVLIMVAGYFAAEFLVLGLFDRTFGLTAAIANLPPNLVQAGISAVVGYLMAGALEKINVPRLAD